MADVRTYYPDAGSADLATMFTLEAGQALETMDVTLARQETYCVRSRVDGTAPQEGSHIRVQIATDLYMGAAEMATGDFATGEGFEVCGLPEMCIRDRRGAARCVGELLNHNYVRIISDAGEDCLMVKVLDDPN